MSVAEISRWREAHHHIEITDEALSSMAPFPSLFANEMVAYLQGKAASTEIVEFVRDLSREIVWVYCNWQKAQRDADPAKLLTDLLNNARNGAEYDFTTRFLRDYARANNIALPNQDTAGSPSWLSGVQSTVSVPCP